MHSEMTQSVVCRAAHTVILLSRVGSSFCCWFQLLSVKRYIIKSSLPSGDALKSTNHDWTCGYLCLTVRFFLCLFHTSRSGKLPVKTDWNNINLLRGNYANLGHARILKSQTTRPL